MTNVKPIINKLLKVILWMAGIVVFLFILVATIIQIPSIQNKIIDSATSFISHKTKTRVEIKNLSLSFPKSIVIEGIFLDDLEKDTLLYADEIKINVALLDLLSNKINVNNITLKDANINIKRFATGPEFNFNFLIAALSDTTNKPTVEVKPPSKWTFNLDQVNLNQIRFQLNDEYGGINIAVVLPRLKLKMDELDLKNLIFSVDELQIDDLLADVLMTESGNPKDTTSGNVLPIITAKKLRINNITATFGDSIRKQSVFATITRLNLKAGSVNLQQEIVEVEKLLLANSEIRFMSRTQGSSTDSTLEKSTSSETGTNWKVSASQISLENNLLAYNITSKPITPNAFDVNHITYKQINLKASDFYYSTDSTNVTIKEFSTVDENNFTILQFNTDFRMDKQSIHANKLNLKTANSTIVADLNLQFSSLNSLKDSIAFLFMNADLKNVSIQNSDLLYFSPQLIKQPFFASTTNVTTFSGIINGQLNNLKGKNVLVKTGAKTSLTTDFTIIGLPDIETTNFELPNLKILSGKQDVLMMAGEFIPPNIDIPENIAVEIEFAGRLKSFASTILLNSSFGNAQLEATIDKNENFNAKVNLVSFNLGGLLKDTLLFGTISLNATANGQGLDKNTVNAKINAEVTELLLNSYSYQNLKLKGNVRGQKFDGKINLDDENAVFDFEGTVNLNPNEEAYNFKLNLDGIDLKKLNFTKDDIRIGLKASANLKGGAVDNLNGKVTITDMVIAKGEKVYELKSLMFASVNESKKNQIDFSSALIGVKYSGTISPTNLIAELKKFLNSYFAFSNNEELVHNSEPSNFNFEIELHNHPILSQILLPQLYEFEPGIIKGEFDSTTKSLKLYASVKKVVYGTTEINNLTIDVNSDAKELTYQISSNSISNAQVKFENILLDGKMADNILSANLSSIDDRQRKKIVIRSQIEKYNTGFRLSLDPDDLFLMNNRWSIAEDNYLEFRKEGFFIHDMFISNNGSQINISSVNNQYNNDLNVEIKDFQLDNLSRIIEKDTSLVKGTVNGNILLKKLDNVYGFISNATINNLIIRDVPIGNLTVSAKDPASDKIDVDLSLSGADNNLTASGYFSPKGGQQSILLKTDIQSLSMKTIEAFSMGQLTDASGMVSGKFNIQGELASPEIIGQLVFTDVFVKPAISNHRLELKKETIEFKPDGIYFDSFTMLDADQNSAVIDGSVKMKAFKDFVFAISVNANNFLLLNTTAKDNDSFFGRMIVDSRVDVSGPLKLPVINGRLKMKDGSSFTFIVPESRLTSYRGEEVVEFTSPTKLNSILYRESENDVNEPRFKGYDLSSIVEIDKNATLRLIMDTNSNDSLVVRGEAALSFSMDRSGKMSLTGVYNLNEGSYLISLQSFVKRKFDIIPGSTIIWHGDPLNAQISLNAKYTVRAAPFDLVAGQMTGLSDLEKGSYKQRFPFWVLLKLRGEILHPEITFEIQLPPEEKGILSGAVNQKLTLLNEDASALNKQVFALLILGRFVQENPLQAEIAGASTLVRTTVSNFLSSQLNKWSSNILPDTHLSFDIQSYDDFQTGQAEGRTEVEIGIKQQLFGERLSVQIGGSIDVEGEKARQNSTSDITSDVTVEYKLTKDGRLRLKGFRHNQYEGAIDGQLVETGAGIGYVRDFNKWRDLFKAPIKEKKASEKETEQETENDAK